ncbi:hypothetical protein [Actinoplanes sp. CA-252034]|uniref:hypothetical protein n=1 Tax=Actinoplanes sp. CA-252034 TaxID=3239906 RepID=UPI003D999280
MEEQEGLRASQDSDQSDFGEKLRVQQALIQAVAKTQSEHTAILNTHTAILNRHTAMHKDTAGVLARLTLDVHGLKNGMEQIIGMLDTLIEQDRGR